MQEERRNSFRVGNTHPALWQLEGWPNLFLRLLLLNYLQLTIILGPKWHIWGWRTLLSFIRYFPVGMPLWSTSVFPVPIRNLIHFRCICWVLSLQLKLCTSGWDLNPLSFNWDHTWSQDFMKLCFLTSHGRKNSVRDKVIRSRFFREKHPPQTECRLS